MKMFAVIMAGGSGTRFWPVSRRRKPKQFLNITGRAPMVVETCNRLAPITRDEEMILVLGQDHVAQAAELFSGRPVHMVAEPVGRNTAPCIGLGAIYARHMGYNGAVAFLPADHFIGDASAFIRDLMTAEKLAESGGIVTLGIMPNRPETGYGYIRRSPARVHVGGVSAYRVLKFVEKPDPEKALEYLESGEYYWNAGIFVSTPDTILEETRLCLPELYEGLMRLEKVVGTDAFEPEVAEVYAGLKGVSFDYGIMEKTRGDVYVIPCECGWSDVGSWVSLYALKSDDHDGDRNLVYGETIVVDCAGSFISARGGRLVTCMGLKNCLVVDTPETLLVADLDRSQDVRQIVERLKQDGKDHLL